MRKVFLMVLILAIFFVGCSTRENPYKSKALGGLTFGKVEMTCQDEKSSPSDTEIVRIAIQSALAKAGARFDEKSSIYFKGTCQFSKANFPDLIVRIESEGSATRLSSVYEVQLGTSNKADIANFVGDQVIRDFAQQWVKSPDSEKK